MSGMIHELWKTIEMDCIARSLSYEDYLALHKATGVKGTALCPKAYLLMDEVFTADFLDYEEKNDA